MYQYIINLILKEVKEEFHEHIKSIVFMQDIDYFFKTLKPKKKKVILLRKNGVSYKEIGRLLEIHKSGIGYIIAAVTFKILKTLILNDSILYIACHDNELFANESLLRYRYFYLSEKEYWNHVIRQIP